jgi:hypothetical protein
MPERLLYRLLKAKKNNISTATDIADWQKPINNNSSNIQSACMTSTVAFPSPQERNTLEERERRERERERERIRKWKTNVCHPGGPASILIFTVSNFPSF